MDTILGQILRSFVWGRDGDHRENASKARKNFQFHAEGYRTGDLAICNAADHLLLHTSDSYLSHALAMQEQCQCALLQLVVTPLAALGPPLSFTSLPCLLLHISLGLLRSLATFSSQRVPESHIQLLVFPSSSNSTTKMPGEWHINGQRIRLSCVMRRDPNHFPFQSVCGASSFSGVPCYPNQSHGRMAGS